MGVKVYSPIVVGSSEMAYTSLPVADYTVWLAGSTYGLGANVTVAGTVNRNYKSAITSNIGNDPTTDDGTKWVYIGPTMRWAAFDQMAANSATASDVIAYRLALSKTVNHVALFRTNGVRLVCRLYNTDVSRRNLMTYSDDLGNAAHPAPTGATAAAPSPMVYDAYGSGLTWKLTEDTSTGGHQRDHATVSVVSGTDYTFSAHIKAGLSRNVALQLPAGGFGSNLRVVFNPFTASVVAVSGGANGGFVDLGDGNYRVWVNATATATTTIAPRVLLADGSSISYTGVGTGSIHYSSLMVNSGALGAYQWIESASLFGDIASNQYVDVDNAVYGDEKDTVFQEVSGDVGDHLFIAAYAPGGTVRIGEIAIGNGQDVGEMDGFSTGIQDYSVIETDEYGNISIVKRPYAAMHKFQIRPEKDKTATIRGFLASRRASPIVAFADEDEGNLWGTLCLGIYEDFSITPTGASVSTMQLPIRGLV